VCAGPISAVGTFETWRNVRVESVMRSKADIGKTGSMAYEKTPSALDGVQFGRATREHKRAAKSSMPRFGRWCFCLATFA
jgi:hypothetical protein